MSFDISSAIGDMAGAMSDSIGEGAGDLAGFAVAALSKQAEALAELAEARASGELDEAEFEAELQREMLITETEMLAVTVIGKAALQKAIQAAVGALTKLACPI